MTHPRTLALARLADRERAVAALERLRPGSERVAWLVERRDAHKLNTPRAPEEDKTIEAAIIAELAEALADLADGKLAGKRK